MMRLVGAVTEGSGAVNEDGYGFAGPPDDVHAAWVFDGVTGINGGARLGGPSDAAWLVARAGAHLAELACLAQPLDRILSALVERLMAEWASATTHLDLPPGYDPPAACLVLVKRYDDGWKALRLGDSCLLARGPGHGHRAVVASPNTAFDRWLAEEARRRRDGGVRDTKTLLAELRPQLLAQRALRNQPGGYSVLDCSAASLRMPEYIGLGQPDGILLCTDGYYRAADHYGLFDDAALLDASSASVERVLAAVRDAEASDPQCRRFPRFKPADDATALMLERNNKGDRQ